MGTPRRATNPNTGGRPAQRLAGTIPRTGKPPIFTWAVTRWTSCWYDVGFYVLLYGWLVLDFIVVLCVPFFPASLPLPWRLEQTTTCLLLSLSQWLAFLSVVPIVSVFFRIAWVRSKSYNLWRLCVVVARFRHRWHSHRLHSILFLVGSCSRIQHRIGVSQTMRGPCIVGEVCSLFFDLERFARGTRNLSGTSLKTVVTWESSSGVSSRNLLVVVETIFPFTFLSYFFSARRVPSSEQTVSSHCCLVSVLALSDHRHYHHQSTRHLQRLHQLSLRTPCVSITVSLNHLLWTH